MDEVRGYVSAGDIKGAIEYINTRYGYSPEQLFELACYLWSKPPNSPALPFWDRLAGTVDDDTYAALVSKYGLGKQIEALSGNKAGNPLDYPQNPTADITDTQEYRNRLSARHTLK